MIQYEVAQTIARDICTHLTQRTACTLTHEYADGTITFRVVFKADIATAIRVKAADIEADPVGAAYHVYDKVRAWVFG